MKTNKRINLDFKERETLGNALEIITKVAKIAKTDDITVAQYFIDEKSDSKLYGYLISPSHGVDDIKSYEENKKPELAYLETSDKDKDYRCTSCGTTFWQDILRLSPDTTLPKFCPECGAKFSTRPIKEVKSDDEERSS